MAAKEGVYSESYLQSAGEHLRCADKLHHAGHYALCHYLAGLAAECCFRSIIVKERLEFDEHHDLKRLAQSAKYYSLVRSEHGARVSQALTTLNIRWRNNHRYRSEDAMRRFVKLHGWDRGIKGDFLKHSSSIMLEAAHEIVNRGEYHAKFTQQGK